MKKNFFPIIITALLFFPGCGTSNSTVPQNLDSSETYASEDNIDISQSNTEDSTESNVISYYDTVIRCDYDTSLLKPITITSDSDFQSLSVFASSTSDNSSEILNAGDCVYAGIVDVTKDDTFDFYFHPEDFTESFFSKLHHMTFDVYPVIHMNYGQKNPILFPKEKSCMPRTILYIFVYTKYPVCLIVRISTPSITFMTAYLSHMHSDNHSAIFYIFP